MRDIKESDWKIFKGVREVALERFCERVLHEIERIGSDATKTKHQRYLAIIGLCVIATRRSTRYSMTCADRRPFGNFLHFAITTC